MIINAVLEKKYNRPLIIWPYSTGHDRDKSVHEGKLTSVIGPRLNLMGETI